MPVFASSVIFGVFAVPAFSGIYHWNLPAGQYLSQSWYNLTSELLTTKSERKPVPFLEANDKIIESDQDTADLLKEVRCQ